MLREQLPPYWERSPEDGRDHGRLYWWVAVGFGGRRGRRCAHSSSRSPQTQVAVLMCAQAWAAFVQCWFRGHGDPQASRHAHVHHFVMLVSRTAVPSSGFFGPGDE